MQSVINRLINEGKEDAVEIYSKIPFFLRTCLHASIDNQPWAEVSEGCRQNDAASVDQARTMYDSLLKSADEYMSLTNQERAGGPADNHAHMMICKYQIMNEYNDDVVRFVEEMAKCLAREQHLISKYSTQMEESHNQSLNDINAEATSNDDIDLQYIEDCKQIAENLLSQTKNLIGEFRNVQEALAAKLRDLENFVSQDDRTVEQFYISFSAEVQSLQMIQTKIISQQNLYKERAVEVLSEISQRSSQFLHKLASEVKTWQAAEAKWNVKVGQFVERASLITRFKRFGNVLNAVINWFSGPGDLHDIRCAEHDMNPDDLTFSVRCGIEQQHFLNILRRLFEINLIVTTQPEGVISIENGGTRASPVYFNRKSQLISSDLRILAGECFTKFLILSSEIELVAETDLAAGISEPLTGQDGQSCLVAETSSENAQQEMHVSIRLRNFCREDHNGVYKQFFRIRYKIKALVFDNEYFMQTLSLPITFSTGATQILEHKAARLWYCASVPDLFSGSFQCPDSLPLDVVIKILDDRVANITSNGRHLNEAEKDFMKGRFKCSANGTVTIQAFLKDKMKNNSSSSSSSDLLNLTFCTWFFAVIHSLEQAPLLSAWLDGIIYGFCTKVHAEEVLMDSKIKEGTVLLRPSMTEVDKVKTEADATEIRAALIMMVKMRDESIDDHSQVIPVPLKYKRIQKNSLYGAVKGVEKNEIPVAKIIYGRNGLRPLQELKNYCTGHKEETFMNYKVLLRKIEKFNIKLFPQEETKTGGSWEGASSSEPGPSKRKKPYKRTLSSSSSSSSSHSPASQALPSPTAAFSVESSLSPPRDAASGQAQRPPRQNVSIPELPGTHMLANSRTSSRPVFNTVFGNVAMDVSKIRVPGVPAVVSIPLNPQQQ